MTQPNQFALIKTRRFLPLFITQFLGAFHDNVFKNAFVVMILFAMSHNQENAKMLTTIAAGVFIVPFIIFSALAGQMADKFPKERIMRNVKIAEIMIALLGSVALINQSIPLSFITLFALGTHSSFFSPSKYSILPQHLERQELIGGNALVNTGTFLAILTGTIAGTLLITLPHGPYIVSALLIASAVTGFLSACQILPAPSQSPGLKLNFNPLTETIIIVRQAFSQHRRISLCILGISWFYFLGGMFVAQIPNYTHDVLGTSEHVLSFFLVLFSIGIAAGGLLNARLLKGRIEGVYVPFAMIGVTLFSFDLYWTSLSAPGLQEIPVTLGVFLADISNWRIVLDITMISMCSGLFVVPLNAIIQHLTPESIRARILAGNSIMNAAFMVGSSTVSAIMIASGFSIPEMFFAFAVANLLVAIYICKILPDYLAKSILQAIFKIFYQVEIRGLENIEKAGPRAVIVGNHVSYLDPPLLAAFLPGTPMFAVNTQVAELWWVKPFLKLVDAFPLDPTNPYSLKSLIRKVEEDRQIVIFPEGRLTDTGSLMKIYDGPGMIADKTDAMILPIRLDGVQHTPFARLKGKVPLKSFPKITITILEPRKFKVNDNLKGRARRAAASRQLYDLMEEMMFMTGDRQQTLFQALLKARYVNGSHAAIAEDIDFKPLSFNGLVTKSLILGQKVSPLTAKGENVGIMLPNSVSTLVTFFALQAIARVPAMLNFSTGSKSISSACRTAQIRTVLTSRKFIEVARLQPIVDALSSQVTFVYLEDIARQIDWSEKLAALLANPSSVHRKFGALSTEIAVLLFTSGSEGEPKAVALSHENLMTNIVQLSSRADFNRQDIVFNCLPMFHSFGLTGGTLLPVLSGIRTFLYPSPLHYRVIPEIVYNTNATIMFGTDTFLQGYAKMANSYDFYRMRYIFAGAEKVRPETRQVYMEKFGVQILEGYGATETSPVIAVNSAMHRRNGTVGRFLAGIDYKLEPVPGVAEGGRLFIHGPNVMRGYYLANNPGILVPPTDGWHDTGDIVSVDADGFVTILGRAKRFAKIAGEMVSLTLVETMAEAVWPDAQHAVINLPDARKGEQLVLLTTHEQAVREDLSAYASAHGITALAIPATIMTTSKIPVLGTGKTDYKAVKELAQQRLGQ